MTLTPEILKGRADFDEPLFQKTALLIVLCPLIWNIVARTEYKFKPLRTILGGPYAACYAMTVWIFCFSTYRDIVFHQMVDAQPKHSDISGNLYVQIIAGLSVALGQIFVWSSFLRLGITGTFLGDYCGILMKERVTGFPFNVLEHPMYVGASMSFFGTSLWNGSIAGVIMTIWVYVCYMIASEFFEGPFTTHIYAEAAKKAAKEGKKSQ